MTDHAATDAPTDAASTAAEVVARLDLATKVRLLSGAGHVRRSRACPEHGIDGVVVADGPHGLRQQAGGADHLGLHGSVPSTLLPDRGHPRLHLGRRPGRAGRRSPRRGGGRAGRGRGARTRAQHQAPPGRRAVLRVPLGGPASSAARWPPPWSAASRPTASAPASSTSRSTTTSPTGFVVDAVVDERTLREVYLAGFEIAVAESTPWTVMCSYNLVNGTYASEHHHLLQDVLRDEWGFEGLVMTDWGAANDRVAGIAPGSTSRCRAAAGRSTPRCWPRWPTAASPWPTSTGARPASSSCSRGPAADRPAERPRRPPPAGPRGGRRRLGAPHQRRRPPPPPGPAAHRRGRRLRRDRPATRAPAAPR